MRWQLIMGIAVAVVAAGSARSQSMGQIAAPVEVAAPLYAYGPDVVEPPKIRPRYNGRYYDQGRTHSRYDNRRYGDPSFFNSRQYRGYAGRGEAYSGNGYRGYRSNRGYNGWPNSYRRYSVPNYDRGLPQYRYRAQRPSRSADQEQFAARVITPQLRGRWRDLGPVYQSRSY